MANVTGGLNWKLDTSGTITTDRVRLVFMKWRPNAVSDTLSVTDANSKVIWEETAAAGTPLGDVSWSNPPGRPDIYNGFIATISAGTLLVAIGG
jgi:hypothetical protein